MVVVVLVVKDDGSDGGGVVDGAVDTNPAQAAVSALVTPETSSAHAVTRQGTAKVAIAPLVGPHWQEASVSAQPAAEMAEVRQEV